jgi:hypothetical protein
MQYIKLYSRSPSSPWHIRASKIERRLKRAEYAIVEIDDILHRMQMELSRLTNDTLIESLKDQTLQLSHYVEQMLPVMVIGF